MTAVKQFTTFVVRPKISITDEDPVTKALSAYNMVKFAGCPDNYEGATYDRRLGRYLTGLDETHPDILQLPQNEREEKQKEILEERAELEKALGKDLHYTNEEFWASLPIKIDGNKVFNTAIPLDRVILKAIEAGKILPMSKEDINNPIYKGVNYYIGKEYEDVDDKNKVRDRERQVVKKTLELLEDFDYAVEVGRYLGIQGISSKMPKANLDDLLSGFLEKRPANKDAFLDAMKEKKEFIVLSNKFKELKVKKLVAFVGGKWTSGTLALGKTEKESVKKLLSADPTMQAELSTLLEDLEQKK